MVESFCQMDWSAVLHMLQTSVDPTALLQAGPDPPVWEGTGERCGVEPPVNSFNDDTRELPDTIFPFNLFIIAVDAINSLSAAPQTPVLPSPIPEGEPLDLSQMDQIAAAFRLLFSAFGIIGAGFMTYRLASRSKEGD